MLYISPNSVMSHLVNTEQLQEFLCRALAFLLVSIQNSCWNDECMLVCLLKKGNFSIGVLWLKTYLKITVFWTVFYLSRSSHNPAKWAFSLNCSWGNKAIQIFFPVEIWILILFHFEGLCCLPILAGVLPPGSVARSLGFNYDSCLFLDLLIYLISLCLSFLIC